MITLRRNSQVLTTLISSNSSDLFGAPILGSTVAASSDDSGVKSVTFGDPVGQNGNAINFNPMRANTGTIRNGDAGTV
jgi:hypothetical protein